MKRLFLKSKKLNLLLSFTEKKQVKKNTFSISTNWLKCLFVVSLLNLLAEAIAQCNSVISNSLPINLVAIVTTFAGSGAVGNTNVIRTAASFGFPTVITTSASSNVFITYFGNNLIRKIKPAGVVFTLAESRQISQGYD